jgi:hypothetical protein
VCLTPPHVCREAWQLKKPRWHLLLAGVLLRGWQWVAAGPAKGWEQQQQQLCCRRWLEVQLQLLLVQAMLVDPSLWVLVLVMVLVMVLLPLVTGEQVAGQQVAAAMGPRRRSVLPLLCLCLAAAPALQLVALVSPVVCLLYWGPWWKQLLGLVTPPATFCQAARPLSVAKQCTAKARAAAGPSTLTVDTNAPWCATASSELYA